MIALSGFCHYKLFSSLFVVSFSLSDRVFSYSLYHQSSVTVMGALFGMMDSSTMTRLGASTSETGYWLSDSVLCSKAPSGYGVSKSMAVTGRLACVLILCLSALSLEDFLQKKRCMLTLD